MTNLTLKMRNDAEIKDILKSIKIQKLFLNRNNISLFLLYYFLEISFKNIEKYYGTQTF